MSQHLPIFLQAMGAGYAADATKSTISGLPGSKAITRTFNSPGNGKRWRVVDCWLSNGERSSGHTTIWLNDEPVWIMHYGGWYTEDALPFLKECLHRAYVTEKRFYGGRGPVIVRGERFTYVNRYLGSFDQFEGDEGILDLEGKSCGYHWYHGMLLSDA